MVLAALAGVAAWWFVGGSLGPAAGVAGAVAGWSWLRRAEPAAVRRDREAVARDVPHLVGLLAAALAAGAATGPAVRRACEALPGPAADRLAAAAARLEVGVEPSVVWEGLSDDPLLAPLGRALARSHDTGAPVVAAVRRLADDLQHAASAATEERARAVGVRAALPLGLCLLPSFLLLGIVPLVAGLLGQLRP